MTTVDTRTGEIVEILSADENDALAKAETTIEQGLKTFVEVGQALSLIRDSRLYRAEYATFEAYCGARWHLSRPRAYQLIEAAEVVEALSTNVDTPLPRTESQARELSGLPADEAAETMHQAHEATGGNVTAKSIREVVAERTQQQAERDVAEFPALKHYADTGRNDRVVALAADLRSFDDDERSMRLGVLDKTIAYEKREAAGEPHPRHLAAVPAPEPHVSEAVGVVIASVRTIRAAMTAVDALAGDIDYDDLPLIEGVAAFLTDLATAVKEY